MYALNSTLKKSTNKYSLFKICKMRSKYVFKLNTKQHKINIISHSIFKEKLFLNFFLMFWKAVMIAQQASTVVGILRVHNIVVILGLKGSAAAVDL